MRLITCYFQSTQVVLSGHQSKLWEQSKGSSKTQAAEEAAVTGLSIKQVIFYLQEPLTKPDYGGTGWMII